MKARMIDIVGCSPRANAEESNDPLYASQTIYRIQMGVLKAHVFHVNCRITSLKCLGLIVRDAHVSHPYYTLVHCGPCFVTLQGVDAAYEIT